MAEGDQEASFAGQQAWTRGQFALTLHVILVLAVAALGFQATLLLSVEFDVASPTEEAAFWMAMVAMLLQLLSVTAGIWLVINRLRSFRATMRVAEADERGIAGPDTDRLRKLSARLDARSWRLLWFQIGLFGAGLLLAVTGVALLVIYLFVTGGMPDGGADV